MGRGNEEESDEDHDCCKEDWVLNPPIPLKGHFTGRDHYDLRHLFRVYLLQSIHRPLYISIKYPTDTVVMFFSEPFHNYGKSSILYTFFAYPPCGQKNIRRIISNHFLPM
ncbi:hypothetical protein M758_UG038800 [Ceratodon purpureus]|nr:hypothetical protein M758_UG038800 [Ceratodon purpureus]